MCYALFLFLIYHFGHYLVHKKKRGVSLVSRGVIEDIAETYVIINDLPLVEVEGKEYYESWLVRRKMGWENSN